MARKAKVRSGELVDSPLVLDSYRRLPLTLEERIALLSAVFAYAPDAITFVDANLVVRAANESAARQMGLSVSEVVGRHGEDLVPGWTEQVGHIYRDVRRTGRPFHAEAFPFVFKGHPERGVTYWDFSVSPVYGVDRSFLGYLVIVRDATQRKWTEVALQNAHEQLEKRIRERTSDLLSANAELSKEIAERKRIEEDRGRLVAEVEHLADNARVRAAEVQAVLDNLLDGVFACDTQACLTLVNTSGLKMLGLDSFDDVERCELERFIDLLKMRHADGKPFVREELPLIRALSGKTVAQELEVIHSKRTRRDAYLKASAAPVRDEKGNVIGAVEVIRDVTETIELDELKDQFIDVAAHELKTPVAIMKGYAQAMLRKENGIPASSAKMLEAINRGADRIDRIVKDLLDIAQLHLGQLELVMEKIYLSQMVKEVVNTKVPASTRHRIRVVRAEPVVIDGDRDRLEQVLANLLDNAVKYSPRDGYVDVAVDARDHEAVVSVRDDGVGIPVGKREHIFERFYRAHAGTAYDYGGMGVGLYISREIVSRHSGTMWFESQEGKGSTFYFSIPLQAGNAKH